MDYVELIEIAIYLKNNEKIALHPDHKQIITEDDLENYRQLWRSACLALVGDPKDLKIFFIYQKLIENEKV